MVDVKLITLLKVYETGNYTRAAEKLSLTQPAVSQHIKQLEREMNAVIFDRTGSKIRPTPEGKLIIQYAERVVSLYESLQQALVDRKHTIDRLRVGVTHTSESNIVSEVLARPTPIRSAAPRCSSASACSAAVMPPVRSTGVFTRRFTATDVSAK